MLRGFLLLVQNGACRLEADRWLTDQCAVAGREQGIDLDRVDWSRITEFFCTCFYALRSRQVPPDAPAEDFWERTPLLHPQRERAIFETVPIPVLPLEENLLALGGRRMVYIGEPDLEGLIERGQAFEGPARLVPGQPSHCHTNVADLWRARREELAIVTGYALSDDGLWRQHSFFLRTHPTPRQRRIIETTARRVRYFGVVLTEHEAAIFSRNNGSGSDFYESIGL